MSKETKIRRKNKKRRKAKNYDDEEYDEDLLDCQRHKEELLPKWKLYAVGAAIFMCFALLYPSVFAPMINSFFGRNSVDDNSRPFQKDPRFSSHPEGFRGGGRPPQTHPAAAASMHAHAKSHQNQAVGGSGSRGGFAWLLPFYTIGVVLFLLYTFFRKKKKPKRMNRGEILGLGDEDSDDEEESSNSSNDDVPTGKRRRYKLRSVQERLKKTEKAMEDILSQLELIAVNKETINEGEDDESNNKGLKETLNMEKSLEKLKKLSAIYKKNERLRYSFEDKTDDSEEEEEDFGEKVEEKEEFSTTSSFEEEEEEEMSEMEEENREQNKEENKKQNKEDKIRKRRKV